VVTAHKSGLGTGPIVGIAIGAFALALLAGVVIYMCGRQKTINQVLRHSQQPRNDNYQPGSPGISEANYPNMQKTGFNSLMSGRFSRTTPYAETERSASPPIDERTGMIMNPASFGPTSPETANLVSPSYDTYEADGNLRYVSSLFDG
jgi:hypothetical protein